MVKRSRNGSRSLKKSSGSAFKKAGTIVKVEWGDAWSNSGWREPPIDGAEALPCTSVGYVLQHTEKGILLAGTRSLEEDVNTGFASRQGFVPAGMIKKIKVLK